MMHPNDLDVYKRQPTNKEKERIAIMPLTMIDAGVETTVKQIHGRDQTRRFLQNLGFVEGRCV